MGADGFATLLQLKTNDGPRVFPSPGMLLGEIALLAAKLSSHGDGALPFEKTNPRSHRVLRRNHNTHMNMIREQMPFQNLVLFLLGLGMENTT